MKNRLGFIWFSFCLCLISTFQAVAQKRNLKEKDFNRWEEFPVFNCTNDGAWFSWSSRVQGIEEKIVIKNLKSKVQHIVDRGIGLTFSANSKWVGYLSSRQNRLTCLNLASKDSISIIKCKTFYFSSNSRWLFASDGYSDRSDISRLRIIDLNNNKEKKIDSVVKIHLNSEKTKIAYVLKNNKRYSLFVFDEQLTSSRLVFSSENEVKNLSWNISERGLCFLSDGKIFILKEDNIKSKLRQSKLEGINLPAELEKFTINQLWGGEDISLSKDCSTLSFCISGPTDEFALSRQETKVDVWHWRNMNLEKTLSNKRIFSSATRKFFLISYNTITGEFLKHKLNGGEFIRLSDDRMQILVSDFKEGFKERTAVVTLINLVTGSKINVLDNFVLQTAQGNNTNFEESIQFSPNGKFIGYYKDKHWWLYDILKQRHVNLSLHTNVKFWDISFDKSGSIPSWGWAGWATDNKKLVVYDQFDVYTLGIDGKSFRKLTSGRERKICFRVHTDLKQEESGRKLRINLNTPIVLTAFNVIDKKSGYFEFKRGFANELIYKSKSISQFNKTENGFAYIEEDYDQPPTIFYKSNQTRSPIQVYETNSQQREYYWGKSELIHYLNKKGVKLQGVLYYPSNYDPEKKYPMVVSIYERLSHFLHKYPTIGSHTLYGTANFSNRGYFVFQPDIAFEVDDPGISAVACVEPAVKTVIQTGKIDKQNIALMGHSWGGYLSAFIISQTNIFKAAIAGSPLTDLVSMSMTTRWGGSSVYNLFEGHQARFSGPFYDRLEAYIRNSPIHQAKNINTPILMAVGDDDGLVDWHQGIEMYNTMRRLQKPCFLLVYPKGNHYLNNEDYYNKQMEYIDFYLKGAPTPKWMSLSGK